MNWDLGLKPEAVLLFVLILTRIGGVFMTAPLLSHKSIPTIVKLGMVVMISFLLMPIVKTPFHFKEVKDHWMMAVAIMEEITIGFVIGFTAAAFFSSIQSAGEIFGMQVGYSIATIFDPANEGDSGVITSLYALIGALLFLYFNGHHLILAAMAKSFEYLPPGVGFSMSFVFPVSDLISKLFLVTIQLASPLIVVMTVISLIMGFLTKLSPQLNIYMNTGFIIGPTVGMLVLMLTLPLFKLILTQMTEQMGPELYQVIHALKEGT